MAMDTVFCKTCALDSKTPGITINPETGLCQFCEHYTPLSKEKKEEFRPRWIPCSHPPKNRGNTM